MGRGKGCCSFLFKPRRNVQKESQGYSVVRFVEDGLVPVWGYAAWKPLDPERKRRLAEQLKGHNVRIAERMNHRDRKVKAQAAGGVADDRGAPKQEPLPLEVVCVIGLWETDVEVHDARQSFDFNQEASLRVRVRGALNFPPDVEPKDPLTADADSSKDNVKRPHGSTDNRWRLKVEVIAVLKVHDDTNEDAEAEGKEQEGSNTKLKVKCEKLIIQRNVHDLDHDWQGDPMVESWLPVQDILEDIELMLENKLVRHLEGIENKHD